MEEIQVGEFVRTKQGEITKIVDTNMFDKTIYKDGQDARYYLEDIVKHSFNLIDLIEVGDYVNGKEVHKYNGNIGVISINTLCWTFIAFKDGRYPIETIVTREQFTSLEYKVEEK